MTRRQGNRPPSRGRNTVPAWKSGLLALGISATILGSGLLARQNQVAQPSPAAAAGAGEPVARPLQPDAATPALSRRPIPATPDLPAMSVVRDIGPATPLPLPGLRPPPPPQLQMPRRPVFQRPLTRTRRS